MIRTFQTHCIRKQEELTERLWTFTALSGDNAGESFPVHTPSAWETYPGFGLYRGEGRYETTFTAGGNVRIECKGVSHTAKVYVDGKLIAEHYNAYTPFSTVVQGLPRGEHTLAIVADNRFSEESALHVPNDYMSYGGVTRPVAVEEIADVYLERIHVTPSFDGTHWHASIDAAVVNLAEERPVTLRISIAGKECVLSPQILPKGESVLHAEFALEDVQIWSPETPKLYTVKAVLNVGGKEVDDLFDRFGFREIKIEGKHILLNGKPLRIRGLCRHEDHPHFGCALPYEAMMHDLLLLKDLGANSVRTAHYPNDERFLDLCDELGILVWEENHARGLSLEQMQNPNFEPQAEQVTREMVLFHYNHPSIYIWGILNECASDSEFGKECYEKQFALIRSLDKTRPCSFASCKFKTDLCFGLPDVVSYNIYPKWYHDTPVDAYLNDLYTWVQTKTEGKGKPFLVTEIGAGGIYGYRTPYASKWSEEYQQKALSEQLTGVLSHPDCSGVYIWQFSDIRISEEWWGGRPRTMNNKGVVDEYRRPKLCYETVKRIFREDKEKFGK